jgi:hypothetical protein
VNVLCSIDTLFFFHRDGKMPVSFIQKYLVKKLDLTSEAEVCLSFLPCHKAKDVWILLFMCVFDKLFSWFLFYC